MIDPGFDENFWRSVQEGSADIRRHILNQLASAMVGLDGEEPIAPTFDEHFWALVDEKAASVRRRVLNELVGFQRPPPRGHGARPANGAVLPELLAWGAETLGREVLVPFSSKLASLKKLLQEMLKAAVNGREALNNRDYLDARLIGLETALEKMARGMAEGKKLVSKMHSQRSDVLVGIQGYFEFRITRLEAACVERIESIARIKGVSLEFPQIVGPAEEAKIRIENAKLSRFEMTFKEMLQAVGRVSRSFASGIVPEIPEAAILMSQIRKHEASHTPDEQFWIEVKQRGRVAYRHTPEVRSLEYIEEAESPEDQGELAEEEKRATSRNFVRHGYLSITDVGRLLHVSNITVWRWVRQKKLPSVTLHGHCRIPAQKVKELAAELASKRPFRGQE